MWLQRRHANALAAFSSHPTAHNQASPQSCNACWAGLSVRVTHTSGAAANSSTQTDLLQDCLSTRHMTHVEGCLHTYRPLCKHHLQTPGCADLAMPQ